MDDSLIQRLKALSSAEDFLQFFGVPFHPAAVSANDKPILKRFRQHLFQADDLGALDDVALFRRYRELLILAYAEVVRSAVSAEKAFKAFHENEPRRLAA